MEYENVAENHFTTHMQNAKQLQHARWHVTCPSGIQVFSCISEVTVSIAVTILSFSLSSEVTEVS
jgi:hypothetical protein